MKKLFILSLVSLLYISLSAQNYSIVKDISYRTDGNEYALSRCKLDIYYPESTKDFPTVVWFHGGGLTSGEKFIPEEFKNQKIAVIAVN